MNRILLKNTMERGSSQDQAEKMQKTILVAEDTDSNYALVYILLRKDFRVVRALNGVEVIDLSEKIHPDLILMDIQMPEMNGLDATLMIRKKDKKVPIVALTAFAFDSDRQAFMDAGGTDYLVKPLDSENLKSIVRKLI
jgi:CheY-like chemotaxis protein